jgi:M6 family metalloprotease-like protein
MSTLRVRLVVYALFIVFHSFASVVMAHDELTQQEIEKYTADGTLDERKARIEALEPFRIAEGNRQRAIYKVQRASLEASGLSSVEAARALTRGPSMAFPFTAQPELHSTGTVKTLTILIDFKDLRASDVLPGLTVDGIRDNIYGTGTTTAGTFKPHESLHEYYRRASQDLVDVQGNVLGWHNFTNNRKTYEPVKAPATLPLDVRRRQQSLNDNKAIFKLLSDALDSLDATHDFAQYDNDNDGDIDLVTILYAGPDTGWGSFWWAYRWQFFVPEASKEFDGKKAKQFVFQFVDTRGANRDDFDPTTLLHEMGHAFGLADYYDYDPDIGPQGGVGGLDMMHANRGNQNAFSRWLLDWIRPTVVGSGIPAVRTLNASGSTVRTDKAIAIFPGLTGTVSPGQEMFIIENRHRVGNDTELPGNGLLIWHVDASVNSDGNDFEYDNSFTDRKLIQLIRADNPHDFTDVESASSATYFINGTRLTPGSSPNSGDHTGNDTRIIIDDITAPSETMSVRLGFLPSSPSPSPNPPLPAPAEAQGLEPASSIPVTMESVLASQEPLDLDTLEALDQQFSTATAAALAAHWENIDYPNDPGPNSETQLTVLKLLMTRWASKDGTSAADAVLDLPDNDLLRSETLPIVLKSWVHNDPAEAAKWYLDEKRKSLREGLLDHRMHFVHDAFEGLYATHPKEALMGLERLSSTAEIVSGVDGIFHSGAMLGENPESLNANLLQSKSDVVKARVELIKALRAAEVKIKDLKQRSEFRDLIQEQHDN